MIMAFQGGGSSIATETYHGYVETTDDALRIFEACRRGILMRRSRRLCESERTGISSGSMFVWDESESGIRRWTDGRKWSPSRVNGCFLVYTELHPRIFPSSVSPDMPLENGLVKKALSLFTNSTSKLHLVCYYRKEDVDSGKLHTPAADPLLCNIDIPRSLYPDIIPEMIDTLDKAGKDNSTSSTLTPFRSRKERRVSVAMAPILANRTSSRPLSYLQTHDCRLVASTQPRLVRRPEPESSAVAKGLQRDGVPVLSAQQTPTLQWQAVNAVNAAAIKHTEPTAASPLWQESDLGREGYLSAAAIESPVISMAHSQQQRMRLPSIDLQVRSLSIVGQSADVQLPPMGSYATAPSSRRNTMFGRNFSLRTPVEDYNNGETPQQRGGRAVRLPPISELLRSINTDQQPPSSLAASMGAASSSSASSTETAVDDVRSKYAKYPWERKASTSVGNRRLHYGGKQPQHSDSYIVHSDKDA
ncbi:Gluconate transport-inducing protein, partial [Coemansia sp. RSA 2559]